MFIVYNHDISSVLGCICLTVLIPFAIAVFYHSHNSPKGNGSCFCLPEQTVIHILFHHNA